MPRWRPLPEELDPQIREFTSQLRRLVERSGMSVATIADRTGYSKSSWERYLGGRLLPPRGAAHALGKVTGIDIRHLETMWELAERAWSRDEMRHDQTMEAIRVAQAREALGEFWDDEPAKGRKWGRNKDKSKARNKSEGKNRAKAADDRGGETQKAREGAAADPAVKAEEWKEKTGEQAAVSAEGTQRLRPVTADTAPPSAAAFSGARRGARNAAAGAASASAGSAAPPADDETAVLRPRPLPGQRGRDGGENLRTGGPGHGRVTSGVPAQRVDPSTWGASGGGRGGPGGSVGRKPGRGEAPHGEPGMPAYPGNGPAQKASSGATPDGPGPRTPDGAQPASRGRKAAALLGGAVAVSAVLGAGVLAFGLPGGTEDSAAAPTPSSTAPTRDLPAGVKCQGADCAGKDPEKMGCGGQNVKSATSAFVGPSMVEVRYSSVCKAAWGRITGAAQGDTLKISADGQAESDKVDATNDAYTEMVAVDSATEARACATLVAGTTGCTETGQAGQAGETAGTAGREQPAESAQTAGAANQGDAANQGEGGSASAGTAGSAR